MENEKMIDEGTPEMLAGAMAGIIHELFSIPSQEMRERVVEALGALVQPYEAPEETTTDRLNALTKHLAPFLPMILEWSRQSPARPAPMPEPYTTGPVDKLVEALGTLTTEQRTDIFAVLTPEQRLAFQSIFSI